MGFQFVNQEEESANSISKKHFSTFQQQVSKQKLHDIFIQMFTLF